MNSKASLRMNISKITTWKNMNYEESQAVQGGRANSTIPWRFFPRSRFGNASVTVQVGETKHRGQSVARSLSIFHLELIGSNDFSSYKVCTRSNWCLYASCMFYPLLIVVLKYWQGLSTTQCSISFNINNGLCFITLSGNDNIGTLHKSLYSREALWF